MMLDRIRVDPSVCNGQPTIRGRRITVEFVLTVSDSKEVPQPVLYPGESLHIEEDIMG